MNGVYISDVQYVIMGVMFFISICLNIGILMFLTNDTRRKMKQTKEYEKQIDKCLQDILVNDPHYKKRRWLLRKK